MVDHLWSIRSIHLINSNYIRIQLYRSIFTILILIDYCLLLIDWIEIDTNLIVIGNKFKSSIFEVFLIFLVLFFILLIFIHNFNITWIINTTETIVLTLKTASLTRLDLNILFQLIKLPYESFVRKYTVPFILYHLKSLLKTGLISLHDISNHNSGTSADPHHTMH